MGSFPGSPSKTREFIENSTLPVVSCLLDISSRLSSPPLSKRETKKTHTHEGYPSRESYAPGDGFTRRRAPKTDWSCLGKGEEFNFENKEVFVFQDFQVDIYFQEKWIDERLRHNGTKRILVKVGRRTVGYRAPAPVESRQ